MGGGLRAALPGLDPEAAGGGRAAPMLWPTNDVAARLKPMPGKNENESAVIEIRCAASVSVPRRATRIWKSSDFVLVDTFAQLRSERPSTVFRGGSLSRNC